MTIHVKSSGLVLIDGGPGCDRALELASHYTDQVLAYASVSEGALDAADNVLRATTVEPTIGEALRFAGERDICWVSIRRGFLPAETLLTDLIIGTGKAPTSDITPGFAVLLSAEQPPFRPWRHALAIIDRGAGPISGFLMFVATVMAEKAGVNLDILVLGAEGDRLDPTDADENIAVNRELGFYREALERAKHLPENVSVTWLTVEAPSDKWTVVQDQVTSGDYDLVITEIGDISIAGPLRRGLAVEDVVSPGNVGEMALRLLCDLPELDVLVVIDAVRLGIQPRRMAVVGAAAAAALTLIAGGARVLTSSPAEAELAASAVVADASATLESLEVSKSEAAVAKERAKAVTDSSRSAAKKETKAKSAPKAPKGGASKAQAKAAQKEKAESKEKLKKAEKKLEAAKDEAATAKGDLSEAQAEVERAQLEVATAQKVFDEALDLQVEVTKDATGLTGILPGGATQEDVAAAEKAASDSAAWLTEAIERGDEALTEAETAAAQVQDSASVVAKATEKEAKAQSEYDADKAKAKVYQDSHEEAVAKAEAAAKAKEEAARKARAKAAAARASSRQSPLQSGTYRLTARYGQRGSAWSRGYHTGLDFAAPAGTNVHAAASGTVISAGWDGAYGNRIGIRHSNGTCTWYNHLSNIDVGVGQEVTTGDKIGDVGNTGNSFGAHLHFEVTQGGDGWGSGSFLNPSSWLGL